MNDASPAEINPAATTISRFSRLARWLPTAQIRTSLALFDQMVVSGTSFVLTVAIGRFCGQQGLGLYTLGFSIVVFALGIQTALVSTPYTVYLTRRGGKVDARQQAGSSFATAGILGLLMVLLALVVTGICQAFSAFSIFLPVAWSLCAMLPMFLLREFARRFDFAHMNMLRAVAIDFSVMAFTLFGVFALTQFDVLTPAAVFFVGGAGCAITGAIWLARRLQRAEFAFTPRDLPREIRRDWEFGRWVLADQVISLVHLFSLPWLLTAFISPEATGLLAACGSIAALSSPFLQGMGNFLSPHFARSMAKQGRRENHAFFWKATGFLATIMSLFALAAALWGEPLLWLLYGDPGYAGYGYLVGLLALRTVFVSVVMTAHHGILALENPRGTASSSLLGLGTTVLTAVVLIPWFGIDGAICATLVGAAVEATIMCVLFVLTLRQWEPIEAT